MKEKFVRVQIYKNIVYRFFMSKISNSASDPDPDGLFLIQIRPDQTKRSGFTTLYLIALQKKRDIFYLCLQVVQRRFLPSLPDHYPDLQHGSACRLLQPIWLGYVHRESIRAPVVFLSLFGWGTSIEKIRKRSRRCLSSSWFGYVHRENTTNRT